MIDGSPNGFVRILTSKGNIIEGFIDDEHSKRGIMRIIYYDGTQEIGWKRNDREYGKFRGTDNTDVKITYKAHSGESDKFKLHLYHMYGVF